MKSVSTFVLILLVWPAVILPAAPMVTQIGAGNEFSIFLESDGSLWATGSGRALGDGVYNSEVLRPEEIISNGVVTIAANGSSLFLKSDGSLWGMGDGTYGQLGDGSYSGTNRPEEIVSNNVIAISPTTSSLNPTTPSGAWA